jgi:hypothetical protein
LERTERLERFSTRFARPLLAELLFDFFKLHDIRIFVMQIKQIDFVGQKASVEDAFFNDRNMVAQRIGVNAAGAHTAASALAANDQAVDPFLGQMGNERRAEKAARALFVNDDVARLRLELIPDFEKARVDGRALAIGG